MVVEPPDPLEGGELDVFEPGPRDRGGRRARSCRARLYRDRNDLTVGQRRSCVVGCLRLSGLLPDLCGLRWRRRDASRSRPDRANRQPSMARTPCGRFRVVGLQIRLEVLLHLLDGLVPAAAALIACSRASSRSVQVEALNEAVETGACPASTCGARCPRAERTAHMGERSGRSRRTSRPLSLSTVCQIRHPQLVEERRRVVIQSRSTSRPAGACSCSRRPHASSP